MNTKIARAIRCEFSPDLFNWAWHKKKSYSVIKWVTGVRFIMIGESNLNR